MDTYLVKVPTHFVLCCQWLSADNSLKYRPVLLSSYLVEAVKSPDRANSPTPESGMANQSKETLPGPLQ